MNILKNIKKFISKRKKINSDKISPNQVLDENILSEKTENIITLPNISYIVNCDTASCAPTYINSNGNYYDWNATYYS